MNYSTDFYSPILKKSGGVIHYGVRKYRYGFNGKEKESDISEGDYDFGARIYDGRLGRWLSLDAHAEKYPWLSPYSAMANNPILVVDPSGKDNIVYLVILPSTYAKLTKAEVADIIKQANENFKNLGLKTEVRVVDPTKFDITKIDKTDAVAVMGARNDVVKYVGNHLKDEKFAKELDAKDDKWQGGTDNPERSENDNGAPSGNIIAIDAGGIRGFAKKVGLSDEANSVSKAGALAISHGAGHNAGQGHAYDASNTTTSVIMRGASDMKDLLDNPNSSYPTNKDITNNSKGQNKDYVAAMKKRFGDNRPSEKVKQSVKP